MKHPLIKVLVLAAITLLAYLPAIRSGFVWDDDYHVTENQALRSAQGFTQLWLKPGITPQYYPLTHTTFWIEWHLWAARPLGYHLDNVLLHIANALLIWKLLERLGVASAFAVALIFAVHPVHVESVAWITERKNVLSGFFYLLALWTYLNFDNSRTSKSYTISLVLFAAAILSKSITASLPAAILLIIYWKRGRILWRDLLPLIPMFVAGLVMSCVTTRMERTVVGASGPEYAFSVHERILIAGRAVWFYARELIWPSPLMFSYPRWPIQTLSWIYPAGVVAVIVALFALRNRLGRGPLVAVLCFVGTLVPALGFINILPMLYSFVADHFQYLASISLIALAVTLGGRLTSTSSVESRFSILLFPFVILAFVVLTFHQSHIYKNLETLWRDTLTKNPSSWMAHNNLGMIYFRRGDLPDAEREFRASLALNPQNDKAHDNLADVLYRRGKAQLSQGFAEQAVASFTESIRLNPQRAEAHNNLGVALASKGRYADAINYFRRALELNPDLAEARQNLAAAKKHLPSDK